MFKCRAAFIGDPRSRSDEGRQQRSLFVGEAVSGMELATDSSFGSNCFVLGQQRRTAAVSSADSSDSGQQQQRRRLRAAAEELSSTDSSCVLAGQPLDSRFPDFGWGSGHR